MSSGRQKLYSIITRNLVQKQTTVGYAALTVRLNHKPTELLRRIYRSVRKVTIQVFAIKNNTFRHLKLSENICIPSEKTVTVDKVVKSLNKQRKLLTILMH